MGSSCWLLPKLLVAAAGFVVGWQLGDERHGQQAAAGDGRQQLAEEMGSKLWLAATSGLQVAAELCCCGNRLCTSRSRERERANGGRWLLWQSVGGADRKKRMGTTAVLLEFLHYRKREGWRKRGRKKNRKEKETPWVAVCCSFYTCGLRGVGYGFLRMLLGGGSWLGSMGGWGVSCMQLVTCMLEGVGILTG